MSAHGQFDCITEGKVILDPQDPLSPEGGGHSLQWAIGGGSAQKGYLIQAGGI